jgi:hypothetical protein
VIIIIDFKDIEKEILSREVMQLVSLVAVRNPDDSYTIVKSRNAHYQERTLARGEFYRHLESYL